ncbi:MAG: hypothetical protein ACX98W_14795 [bacterium]
MARSTAAPPPCDHFYIIFTIPHELLGLWQVECQRLSDHLFRASGGNFFELLEDDRYRGARPGLLAPFTPGAAPSRSIP